MKTREPVEFRRGDILWIQCDPSVGVLPRKTRTCVVVSNDVAHRYEPAVKIAPLVRPARGPDPRRAPRRKELLAFLERPASPLRAHPPPWVAGKLRAHEDVEPAGPGMLRREPEPLRGKTSQRLACLCNVPPFPEGWQQPP
jgi:hypothetical protein